MGRHGTNGINENGEISIDFCAGQGAYYWRDFVYT
jgi:hypothetical protein